MKVAVVAPVSLAEPRRGDAVRIAGLTAQLARSAEVVLFSSTPPGSLSIPNAELPVRAHWYIPAVRYSDVRTAYRTVFRGLAYDSARFGYDVEAMHAPPESFDVAYLHLPRSRDIWTQLKSRFPAGLEAADLQNDDADMWEQRSRNERLPWIRLVCGIYAGRAAARISSVLASAQLVFCVSEEDRQTVLRRNGVTESGKLVVLPNGVDVDSFRRPAGAGARSASLVFVGSLDIRMNQVAARSLITRYWPAVRAMVADVDLVIVGRQPPPWLQTSVADRITVVASPPDIRPYLWEATAFMAPFSVGSGSKIKILEAMAAGTPVIGTAEAMQGIPALPGVHFLPMASPTEGAAAVKELLRDPGLGERIGTQAQELVAKSDWRVIAASAVAEMSRAAAQSGARA